MAAGIAAKNASSAWSRAVGSGSWTGSGRNRSGSPSIWSMLKTVKLFNTRRLSSSASPEAASSTVLV
jgi:hypothetical protein